MDGPVDPRLPGGAGSPGGLLLFIIKESTAEAPDVAREAGAGCGNGGISEGQLKVDSPPSP